MKRDGMLSDRALDVVLGSLFFLLACMVAYRFLMSVHESPQFYQFLFTPAVLQACGHGFVNIAGTSASLTDFLALKQAVFRCEQLPSVLNIIKLDNFQIAEHYLMSTVALIWRWFGITWGHALWLNMILYGLTVSGAYCVFRLGMQRILSVMATLLILFSSFHLSFLPHLRDYSVAPFTLWFVYCLGTLVSTPRTIKALSRWMIFVGLLLGIGIGFRNDLLLFVPFYIMTVLFFLPNHAALPWSTKCSLGLLFFITFYVMALPILGPWHQAGGNMAHVIILGLTSSFTNNLGLQASSVYFLGDPYSDQYVQTLISHYGQRVLHHAPVTIDSPMYDSVGSMYLLDVIKNYPADILIRFYGSIKQIMWPSQSMVGAAWPTLANKYYLGRILFFCAPFVTFFILACCRLRVALFYFLMVLFFAGYPLLQFSSRHYFYLEFMNLWCVGFMLQCLGILWVRRETAWMQKTIDNTFLHWKSLLIFFGVVSILAYGALWGTRAYQTWHLRQLFTYYQQAATQPLTLSEQPMPHHKKRLSLTSPSDHQELYVKIILSKQCSPRGVPITLRFDELPTGNLSMAFFLQSHAASTTLYLPIYPQLGFRGIEIDAKDSTCLQSIVALKANPNIRLWPIVWLPEAWQHEKLYQHQGRETSLYISPDLTPSATMHVKLNNHNVTEEHFRLVSTLLKQQSHQLIANGFVSNKNKMAYLGIGVPKAIAPKPRKAIGFFARGVMLQGGITLGLLNQSGAWDQVVNIITPGPFKVYFNLTKSGTYTPVIANALAHAGKNHVKIDHIGWVSHTH